MAAIAVGALLISLVGMQLVEVAKANPGLHGFPPEVIIYSPGDGGVYSGSAIPVKFQVFITGYAVAGYERLKWVSCTIAKYGASQDSWDGNFSVPLDYNGPVSLDISGNYSSVITGLSNGKYVLSVTGQTYFSFFSGSPQQDFRSFAKEAFFTVDTPIPKISNISIENKTYTARDIPLNFTVNETPSSVWYSLDNKTEEALNANSTTFLLSLTGLSEGDHSLVVYANDTCGNIGSSSRVDFSVDTLPPTLYLSIRNTTYNSGTIPLEILVDNSTSWLGYSVDGKTNVTVSGNLTLTGLAEGEHSVVAYANDSLGNTGKSDTVFFDVVLPTPSPTLEPTLEPTQTASPTPIGEPIMVAYAPQIAVGTVVAIAAVAVGILAYFKRRKGKR